jgi:hypothetical protein
MAEQRNFPWLPVLLGVGCVAILCVGVLVVGGGAAFFITQRSTSQVETDATVIVPEEALESTERPSPIREPTTIEPTITSPPNAAPTMVEPTTAGPGLTGSQVLEEYYLFDDFSSDALGWPIYDDGKTVLKYENQAYSFQILEPDYYDWVYIPVDFSPPEIWFDVQGPSGSQDGTFGVFCRFQDEENYYYVEFDLADNTYVIGQILNGEFVPLTEEDESGQYWRSASPLHASPTAINRIGVGCYKDIITLFVNDEWVDEVSVSKPFSPLGDVAFFVYAYDFADENGYKVIFDNVEVWAPVQ